VIFDGLKVLELGAGAAGPVATKVLAEHGAHVVRVESARRPDFLRTLFLRQNDHGLDGSPMYVLLNPNKDSVSLDLKKPEAIELVKQLVGWADVVCENFAPGVMARWRLDAESLRRDKPELIVASGCLFGQTGPQRTYPGFGGQGSAIAGFNHLTGWPDREPHGPWGTITDSLSPRYVAVSIAAALFHRRRTGQGSTIDLSQIESGVYSLSEMVVRWSAAGDSVTRAGNGSETLCPHGVYPCTGVDRWIAIAVEDDAQWTTMASLMDAPDLAGASRFEQQEALDARIAAWTSEQDPHRLMQVLQDAGVPAGVVQNVRDLLDDPQLAQRGHWVPLRHDPLGEMLFERSGFRLSDSAGGLHRPGPNLGEHNRQVLGGILGLSDGEIDKLIADEIVA
jgi:benzylsuccinate CoA-transferase BbsF subunit